MAADIYFNDREERIVACSLPRSSVMELNNQVEIRSLADTPAERSQFYLDWLEVNYSRWMRARQGWLSLTSPLPVSGHYFLDGFSGDTITVWDLDAGQFLPVQAMGRSYRAHFRVTSAGYLDGERAIFELNGATIATGYRGHNLLRLNPLNGAVIEQKNFDTYASAAQADSMAAYINRLPDSSLILLAIRDEGSVAMTETAHQALEALGSAQTRDVGVRDSYVLYGRKGTEPGSVPELLKKSGSGPAVLAEVLEFSNGGDSQGFRIPAPQSSTAHLVAFESAGLQKPLRMNLFRSTDLRSTTQGADYIVITHPLFRDQAERLAAHRSQKDGLRTRVVLVEEIEDEFNYGLADPVAIRAFLQYTYNNWVKPAPRFVLFFGDACWDNKGLTYNANQKNYVPSYGNPVSDSWFSCLDGPDDMLPDMFVGRLPVSTAEQAETAVDKILAYENTPSAEWKKDFLFITGGFDYIEQMQFSQQSQQLVNEFVVNDPVFGRAISLHKTTQGLAEGEHRQDILESINNGMIWVNFIGHAGSRTWDLMFHSADIEALENSPRYPFITSMTCHTGRFAEPNQVAFGEQFVLTNDRGAIGFLGSSGWGYSFEDYAFLRYLYPKALKDTLRCLGEIVTKSKWALWQSASSNAHVRDMVYQYNLLGDPAVGLAIPTMPDLTVKVSGIVVTPEMPSEADSMAQVKVVVNNYGLVARDSTALALAAVHPNVGRVEIGINHIGEIGRIDSSEFSWYLRDMVGAVELEAVVDADDVISEADESNNLQRLSVTVLSSRIQLIAPPMDALIPWDQVVLKILNPQDQTEGQRSFVFSVDTTLSFDSPLLQTSGPVRAQSIIVRWQPQGLQPEQVYYWSARDLSDSVYQPGLIGVFKTSKSDYGWEQERDYSWQKNENINLSINNGVILRENQDHLYVDSASLFDGNFVLILVNGSPVLKPHRGHNLAVLDPVTGTILSTKSFDTYADSIEANKMADFIYGIDEGHYVMVGIMDEGSVCMTERAYQSLESIGSAMCRKVGYRYSWSIIGRKGAAISTVPEAISQPRMGSAVVHDTLCYFSQQGEILSPLIGATKWKSLSWYGDQPAGTDIQLNVIGVRRNTVITDTIIYDVVQNTTTDLSAINVCDYPFLKLNALFFTTEAEKTPYIHSWRLLFDPVPDLALSPEYFSLTADTVLAGEAVLIKLQIFNIGLSAANSIMVRFSEIDQQSSIKSIASLVLPRPLAVDDQIEIDQQWMPQGSIGVRQLIVRVDPENVIPELNESNNVLNARVYIRADTTQPWLRLLYDDREIAPGDLVSRTPCIRGLIYDDSPGAIDDTMAVRLYLDGQRIYFAGNEATVRLSSEGEMGAKGVVYYYPQLTAGYHYLELTYNDDGGNQNGIQSEFKVETDLKLLNVLNYPNPFANETHFTFELTQPAQVSIKVFTVAGRMILDQDAGWLGAGFNRVHWDGRDVDGDGLANGVYLYKVTASNESGRVDALEKAVVMR
ncbi:T9SS type A sorting domain-containing protein [candidate division KSB1 bacterium]|nr:T9SS type A sorting domain-containing protein [candidate division KSB1 bacterium]